MNIIFIRNAFISKAHYMSCEIQLVKALNALGHNAKLIGIDDYNEFGKELILLKSPFGKRRYFLLKLSIFLPFYSIIKKIDAIIVDPEIIPGTIFLLLLKKLFSIKVILDVRSIPVEEKLPWDYKLSCKIAQIFFDGATFITNGTKNYIEQLLNSRFNKSEIFPSAVNPLTFSSFISNNISREIKEKVNNRMVFFYHGSISPNRGINLILDAINQIKIENPNILFVSLSGNNNYIIEYCNSKNYHLENHLLLLDIVDHEKVPAYIQLADLCIIPLPKILWWEISSPLKLMEYLAMEKPIIISDIEAHRLVVPKDSGFAYYFNPDDPEDLGKILIKAIRELEKLKYYAYKGREMVLDKYSWDIQARVIENFISHL